ncbi:MAG: Cys-tRNA(Pro) deacylase [Oscillospiraceae bacterium]|nr:Cys-tRNA(Pro) deacylase [Oscillospiraceae bacterium]
MEKPVKTNAIRMLEKAGLAFRLVTYEVDEEDLSGVHVAQTLGLPVEQVVKTLVLKGDKTGYLVACIPVETELDLKALATASGNKTCEMIAVRELLPLTGYIRGGCSPVGMKKPFPTFFDEAVTLYDWISVSAGMRGAQILIDPQALIEFIGAEVADIAR